MQPAAPQPRVPGSGATGLLAGYLTAATRRRWNTRPPQIEHQGVANRKSGTCHAAGAGREVGTSESVGPALPAGYSDSGTSPACQAASTGSTMRQHSSAVSPRTDNVGSP